MSNTLAQIEAEQALAAACYHLGDMLVNQHATIEEVTYAKNRHFQQLDALISTSKWQLLAENLALSNPSLSLLAIVYLFQLEPDLLSTYAKLSWYEQGGGISAKRALSLAIDETENDSPLDFQYLALSTQDLIQAQLLICSNPATPLMQSLTVSEPLFRFMVTKDITSHPITRTYSMAGWLTKILDAASPATAVVYREALRLPSASLNIVKVDQQEEALAFIHNLILEVKQQGVNIGDLWLVRTPLTGPESARGLQDALLQVQLQTMPAIQAIYWPTLFFDCIHSVALRNLAECLMNTSHIIVFCQSYEAEQQESDILWIREWEKHLATYYEPKTSIADLALGWRELCDAEGQPDALSQTEAEQLAERYPLVTWQMADVFNTVLKDDQVSLTFASLQQACLKRIDTQAEGLARFALPRIKLDDMVLKKEIKEQLEEIMARMQYRSLMTSQAKGFLSGTQALFWGPPGTGKTMAAEAIAGELGLPIYKVNLSNVASKWIGETEKHLSTLFDQAEKQRAVLLFDEADSIFAKRSEVESSHDKNANMGVSFLLQRMETYQGILLLSTNFKANIDDAFLRRFNAVIEFALPDKTTRESLWKQAWQGSLQLADTIKIDTLASEFELSPSQIRNVAERACLLALMASEKVIHQNILAKALRREFDKQSAGFVASKRLTDWLK